MSDGGRFLFAVGTASLVVVATLISPAAWGAAAFLAICALAPWRDQ